VIPRSLILFSVRFWQNEALSAISESLVFYFPFVFDKMWLCRRFSETSKKFFRSFLKKNASVGEFQVGSTDPKKKFSPTERKKVKNERKPKCED
jgi:chromosomal replication initiation ATPase DnaA